MLLPCPRERPAILPFTALLQPGQRLLPSGGGPLRASLSSGESKHAGVASGDPGTLTGGDLGVPLEPCVWRWKNLRKATPRLPRCLLLEAEVQDMPTLTTPPAGEVAVNWGFSTKFPRTCVTSTMSIACGLRAWHTISHFCSFAQTHGGKKCSRWQKPTLASREPVLHVGPWEGPKQELCSSRCVGNCASKGHFRKSRTSSFPARANSRWERRADFAHSQD